MRKLQPEWQIAWASVRGKSHIDASLPNQDAVHLTESEDGSCFAVAISDGAGSAPQAEAGARHFSQAVADGLLSIAQSVQAGKLVGSSRNAVGDRLLEVLTEARRQLDPSGLRLKDFACNLMAVCFGPGWGLRVHLGDAVLLKSSFKLRPDERVDYFVGTQMTSQDRSEYANETHFITQSDWTRHLVWDCLDPSGDEDLFALMTDGAADVALSNIPNSSDRRVFRGFFVPLVAQVLRADREGRNKVISDALSSSQTYRLTGDDKTMALLIRTKAWDLAPLDPVMSDPGTSNAGAPSMAASSPPQQAPKAPPAPSGSTSSVPLVGASSGAAIGSSPISVGHAKSSWHWVAFVGLGVLLGALLTQAAGLGRARLVAWEERQASVGSPAEATKPSGNEAAKVSDIASGEASDQVAPAAGSAIPQQEPTEATPPPVRVTSSPTAPVAQTPAEPTVGAAKAAKKVPAPPEQSDSSASSPEKAASKIKATGESLTKEAKTR